MMKTIQSSQQEEMALERPGGRISTLNSIFEDILRDIGGVPKEYLKKGADCNDALITVLYLCILVVLRDRLLPGDFKYPTQVDFMCVQAYREEFASESATEKELLWQSANWMSILFKIVKANANLGLAMAVVPKLVEGWDGNVLNLEMVYVL